MQIFLSIQMDRISKVAAMELKGKVTSNYPISTATGLNRHGDRAFRMLSHFGSSPIFSEILEKFPRNRLEISGYVANLPLLLVSSLSIHSILQFVRLIHDTLSTEPIQFYFIEFQF